MKKLIKKLWSRFTVWLTPILEDRKTRLAMVIVPAITVILLFILSSFWGKFAAVLLLLSLIYWIFDRAK